MIKKVNPLKRALARVGIHDAEQYLLEHEECTNVVTASDPDVEMRGNVQMMMQELRSLTDIDKEAEKLTLL
ncbi:MAG: hypothetical protein N4A53_07530 [Pelagimonas sp.]|jgi:hypothetical protein|nr:hypothetical protein [Pelagimonas sp.]